MFVFLPFSHLFLESIGLPGTRKGIKSRIIETILLLTLIAVCVIGISFVATSVFDYDNPKRQSILNILGYYLPFLYSCLSILGVILLCWSTPLGFICIFDIISKNLVKSSFIADVNEDMEVAELEKITIEKRIFQLENNLLFSENEKISKQLTLSQNEFDKNKERIEILRKKSKWKTLYINVCFLIIIILMSFLFSFIILTIFKNIIYILFDFIITKFVFDFDENLNKTDYLFSVPILKTTLEILIIMYFMIASLIGFYSIPFFGKILPKLRSTTMDKLILNCALSLILSSALPVSTKLLGLTSFDLLGYFGDYYWHSKNYIIFIYNVCFLFVIVFFFFGKFRESIIKHFHIFYLVIFQQSDLFSARTSFNKKK